MSKSTTIDSRIDDIQANSYRDFHARGLDYLCIRRDLELTLKVYFFDGDASKIGEVVNPHDHRYHFESRVLAGEVENVIYSETNEPAEHFDLFHYTTPLNGSTQPGFKYLRTAQLKRDRTDNHQAGAVWDSRSAAIHTLSIRKPGTVLFLRQYVDVLPIGTPTRTFVPADRGAPSLQGLYRRFTRDEIVAKIAELEARTGKTVDDLLKITV